MFGVACSLVPSGKNPVHAKDTGSDCQRERPDGSWQGCASLLNWTRAVLWLILRVYVCIPRMLLYQCVGMKSSVNVFNV